jgi:hypothetical protein
MKGGHRGGLGLIGEPKLVDTAAAGRELHELGKSIARRSQRGLGLIGETKVGGHRGCWARTARIGKASHRGHRGPFRLSTASGFAGPRQS